MGISEVPEEDESVMTYQKNKRVKNTKPSDLPKTDSEITQEEDGSTLPDLPHRLSTSLDQPVEFEPVYCGDERNQEPSLPPDNHQSASLANDVSAINRNTCDELASKLLEENVQVHNMEPAVENIDKFTQVNASVNVAVDKAFAGYTGKKLLVLDVNGLLVDISSYVPYDYDPDEIILRKAVFKRPYCDDFLKFCFERFNVGVWSSKTKRNMEPILDFLMGKEKSNLLFCWDQSHCTYTGYHTVEKRHKPLLLKKLKKLWDKCEPDLPWERGMYNASNTLLLDDSPYKALCNPRYTAIFPHTYHFRDVKDNSLGPDGDLCTYLKGLALAENVQEYVRQNPFGQRPITEKNLSWGFYLKVIEASSSPPHQTANHSKT